jgi:L-fucose isomerase
MKGDERIKVGVISPNDPRPWVRESNIDLMIDHERKLISALKSRGVEVIRGGDGYPKEDQIPWNTRLIREQARKIAKSKPDAIIVNEGSWTFPYDSRDAVINFIKESSGDVARVVIFSYKDTQVPGLVAGMAVGGALSRIGIPYQLVYGRIDKEPRVLETLMNILKFYKKCSSSSEKVKSVINKLHCQKYLALGGMSLKMPTTTADVDQWAKYFGITYEALDQSELKKRALEMVVWEGEIGKSKIKEIKDKRVEAALRFLYDKKHGKFDFTREKLTSIDKFIYQLAFYYAAVDLAKEYDVTFMGIKCQDELSANDCTMCIAAAFLNNNFGPDGKNKDIIPTACENDMDSALTQLLLYLLTGKPAGFGDFRDVSNRVLAIVNCGQHPPYFYGKPEDSPIEKLNNTEYMGQEIFYAAGGSSVRGRTPGGQEMTVARLARENLRYYIVAMPIKTVDVDIKEHAKYNFSWPIIKGQIPISDRELIELWPCNHLGFCFGDLTPEIVELATRLNIGYKVYDSTGRLYYKPS